MTPLICAQNKPANSLTWELTECPEYQFCNIANSKNRSCISPSSLESYLVPGETCKNDGECYSGVCGGNKRCTASGTKAGDKCSYDYDCSMGMFCNSGGCKALATVGSACDPVSAKCVNTASCVQFKCIYKASLSIGDLTTDPFACKSLFALYDHQDQFKCHQPPILNQYKGIPITCTPGNICTYHFDPADKEINYTTTCKCGINPSGNAYCNPGAGSYAKYMSFVISIVVYFIK